MAMMLSLIHISIAWFKDNVALRDSIIRRSTIADTNYSTDIRTSVVASLLIQPPLYNDLSDVEWMELKDNILLLKDLKLYTINSTHATCALSLIHIYNRFDNVFFLNNTAGGSRFHRNYDHIADAVSYTHLDVYKRQFLVRALVLELWPRTGRPLLCRTPR